MSIIKKFGLQGDFLKNTFFLISGAGLSQLIPLVFSPILTRLYTPEDFGRLAIYMACCSIFSIVSTGLYEMSIMLPKADKKAINILGFICLLSFGISTVLFISLFVLKQWYEPYLSDKFNFEYLIVVPFGIFFTGLFQALTYWLNRKKQYKMMNISKILQSCVTVFISILLGYLGYTLYGMLVAFILGSLASIIPLILILIRRKKILSKNEMFFVARQYSKYPKMMMPSSIMNTTATLAPVFLFNKFYSSKVVGSYSFATRILTAPVGIVSTAIGQIFFKNVSSIVHEKNRSVMPAFLKTFKVLLVLSAVLFLPFYFFGETVFSFVFGKNWADAGKYIEILSIAVFVRFIVSPLSTVFHATDNHKSLAFWQTTYFLTTITVLTIFRNLAFIEMLWIYVLHETILYSFYLLLMYNSINKYDSKILLIESK